jgi:hypothetical protein
MKNKKSKLEAQQEQLDIPVVMSWRLIWKLLMFKHGLINSDRDVNYGVSILLWMDVIGVLAVIGVIISYACS